MDRFAAERDLTQIRRYMDQAGRFEALSPLSGIVAGTAAILGTLLTEWICRSTLTTDERITAIAVVWSGVFLVSLLSLMMLTVLKLREVQRPFWSHLMRLIGAALGPNFLVAALLTLYLMERRDFTLIPCVWMLTYGAGVCAASLFSYRVLFGWGLLFVATGALSLFLPLGFRLLFTGIAFGGLHWAYAAIVAFIRDDERCRRPVAEGEIDYERLFVGEDDGGERGE